MAQPAGQVVDSETADPRWKGLFIAGGVAALVAVLFFRRWFGVEMVTFKGFGILDVPTVHPSTAAGWFSLLQGDPLVGLLLFDVIHLVNDALLGLVFLALYATLHRANRSAMTIATICGLVGGGPDCPWAFPPCPPQAGQRKGRGC